MTTRFDKHLLAFANKFMKNAGRKLSDITRSGRYRLNPSRIRNVESVKILKTDKQSMNIGVSGACSLEFGIGSLIIHAPNY